ncbi:MMPL family transporter [Candidatus Woesearchaeota archaeon]|nr:MMPL family transporter [Candidatus Woesearchaeota archaeon]
MFHKLKEKAKHIYEHHYKKLLIVTFLIVLLSAAQIGYQYTTTGDFVQKGITLKGGSSITIQAPSTTAEELEMFLKEKHPQGDISVRSLSATGKTIALIIDSDAQKEEEIQSLLKLIQEKVPLQKDKYSVEVVGSSLGEGFFRQTFIALLVAFALMSFVIFLYFRVPLPSLAVLLTVVSDMVVTLAIFNLSGMKLSSAGVAAFLMLLGYSTDADMLLKSRVLKRQWGTEMDGIYSAVSTGMLMTATALIAILVALIFVNNEVIRQIMFILTIGLLVDAVMTWIQNVGLFRLYLERQRHNQK